MITGQILSTALMRQVKQSALFVHLSVRLFVKVKVVGQANAVGPTSIGGGF